MKKIKYIFILLKQIAWVNLYFSQEIHESGIKNDHPYIKLKNGKIFYGFNTNKFRLYFLFSKKIKRKLCKESINLLFDILNRYQYPINKDHISVGKYYDFNEGEIVLELGAYIGLYALKASELVYPKGKVIAVEASPKNFEVLKLNISENHSENIIAIHKTIWSETTKINFTTTENQKNSIKGDIVKGNDITKVKATTVDNLLSNLSIEKVDFIRIQLNGAEYEALLGMREILKKKPKLLIAVPYIDYRGIEKTLKNYNYNYIIRKKNIFAY
jgi:FkbM family methyltransferase